MKLMMLNMLMVLMWILQGLASFTHTYAGEVLEGEKVIARGKVERLKLMEKPDWYRIVVGTTRDL